MPSFCVIAFAPDRQEQWIDLVLAADVRGAAEKVAPDMGPTTIARARR
jgi:hypothetical protein